MRDMIIKICGITNVEDALKAAELGADWLGLIFVSSSPRRVDDDRAREISERVRGKCKLVGVFQDADADELAEARRRLELDFVQLHGNESASTTGQARPAVKAVTMVDAADRAHEQYAAVADYLLLDRSKTHQRADWLEEMAQDLPLLQHIGAPFLMAGGITPDNVSGVVRSLMRDHNFAGIDVASGVESAAGVKDHEKMRTLIQQAREAADNAIAR